ncbi:MAG: phosphoribosylformylglycinamidine synthase subunit PurL [Candidatus Bathyarchaeota archaeon]
MPQVAGVKVDLTGPEMKQIRKMLGREPNGVEWGMFDIMHSEHCSYKSSRPLLKLLPTKSSRVLVGPGYDSGIVDIGDGYVVAFKIESHNHPSALEPYNGAATGIGGIVRDIFCVGARPVALSDPLRFGSLKSGQSRWLFQYVVKGIGGYGNCIGVPTVSGEVEFDESFETNCIVNVACFGIAKREDIILAELRHPGDILVLAGGATGRDGIHGVTFASKNLTEKSEEDRPAVQVGDPFTKKLLIEGVLEILKTGFVHGLKDLGGGGLTCAASEMSSKGGAGLEIMLDALPVREEGMTPFELMLSESQERMLFAIPPEHLDDVLEILRKYEIPHAIIGKVTNTKELVAKLNGKIVAKIPSALLTDAPVILRKSRKPKNLDKLLRAPLPKTPENLSKTFLKLLSTPNIASKEWVYRQYDHEVGVRTVLKPGDGDAAVLKLLNLEKAIALKTDSNSRHSYLDPFNGHAGSMAEAARNVVAVGAEPIAYTDCCNFGNPEKPEVFWQFKRGIEGLAYMSKGLGIPCVGGNVSFYNEDDRTHVAVKPSTAIVMLGLIDNIKWITSMAFKNPGDKILAIGKTYPELGGSEYFHEIHKLTGGKPPRSYVEMEKASMDVVMKGIRGGLITSAHDCSKGGIAVALAIMAIKGKLGANVELSRIPAEGINRIDSLMFSESQARFIVTSPPMYAKKLLKTSVKNTSIRIIGDVVASDRFTLNNNGEKIVDSSLGEMKKIWEMTIPKAMGVI